jgi:8-hydroxy-5-deazaflavin:NADPH oxidoreductase
MDIGILGAGHMGRALARHLAAAGHDVRLANSRGPGSLADVVADLGHGVQADTIVDTVAFADVVFFAVPYEAVDEIAGEAEPWDGKIVVDLTNAGGEVSSSAVVASLLPGARVVKAFNTIFYRRLEEEGRLSEANRLAVFYATDDDEAGEIVARLIGETGFAAVRTGSLDEGGRRQQPGSDLFDVPLTRAQAESRLRG